MSLDYIEIQIQFEDYDNLAMKEMKSHLGKFLKINKFALLKYFYENHKDFFWKYFILQRHIYKSYAYHPDYLAYEFVENLSTHEVIPLKLKSLRQLLLRRRFYERMLTKNTT